MPECTECGTPIQSGTLCQMHALEAQHGTLADGGTVERSPNPQCEVCNQPILESDRIKEVRGEPAHADCGGQARCDGGRDLAEWLLEHIEDQVADEATEAQDNSLWTSKARLKAEASKVDFAERHDVTDFIDGLEMDGKIVYWHGLIAPATADHVEEIIESEVQAEYPRGTLIGRLNQARARADGGDD